MTDILPCPMCGSPAVLEATGTSECYGRAWQTLYIECTKEKDKHCGMDLSLRADFWGLDNSNDVIVEAWNKLTRKIE